jgi:tetratricopeptide (TPR) repeat protein
MSARAIRACGGALTVVAVLATGFVPAAAQAGTGRGAQRTPVSALESRLIRDASLLEVRGDHAGAEQVLSALLEEVPTSAGALFAIERSLRAQERTREVLPMIDRLLALEPRASNVRTMKLRILVEVDSLETLEDEAVAWIQAEPGSADPYRELARMYERAYGAERAAELLREGRARTGDPGAFALELGDLLLRADDAPAAVREWSGAIGEDGRQTGAVVRRVAQLGRFEEVGRLLLLELEGEPTTPARRVAAVRVALQLALAEDALRLARDAIPRLPETERRALLEEVARRGDELEAHALSLWAYETLRGLTRDPEERRALHAMVAGSALALGDTARALEARSSLARSFPTGSAERRRVLSETLRLEVEHADAPALGARLEAFRGEFPDAPELDELASLVAFGLQARGDHDAATAVLQDVQGPRSALERAYLHLERGEVDEGVVALHEAVGSLPPSVATEVIQLLSLLGRVGPPAAQALGQAAVLSHRGSRPQAIERLTAALPSLPAGDRPALLAHAARLADAAGRPEQGAELRRRLLDEHRDAQEMPEAALALARWSARAGRPEEAIRLLEALIIERPNSSVVPDARRELGRIRGQGELR